MVFVHAGIKTANGYLLNELDGLREMGASPWLDVYMNRAGQLCVKHAGTIDIGLNEALAVLVYDGNKPRVALHPLYGIGDPKAIDCVVAAIRVLENKGFDFIIFSEDRAVILYTKEKFSGIQTGLILTEQRRDLEKPLKDRDLLGYSHVAIDYGEEHYSEISVRCGFFRNRYNIQSWMISRASAETCENLIDEGLGVIAEAPDDQIPHLAGRDKL